MFESNYNYVPNPYPPAPAQDNVPGQGWIPPKPYPVPPQPPHPPYPPMPPVPPMPPAPVFVDKTLSIPGAAADAAVTGKLIGSKVDLESLSGNIQIINGKVDLLGLADAENGAVPSKAEDGSLVWIPVPSVEQIESIESSIDGINTSIRLIDADIVALREANARQSLDIADLSAKVDLNNDRVTAVETLISDLSDRVETVAESKLDKEVFNAFLEEYNNLINDAETGLLKRISDLEDGVEELQRCCGEVKDALTFVLGDLQNLDKNYEQPIYQTLQDFETHAQAMNRDFDGGDLDELVETFDVPNVVGYSAILANTVLGQHGFFTEASLDGSSFDEPNMVVISQNPVAGAKAERGAVIELEVAEGVNG